LTTDKCTLEVYQESCHDLSFLKVSEIIMTLPMMGG